MIDKKGEDREVKRALIGGFLALLGTIWGLAVILYAGNNPVSAWATPPGRFLTTVAETGMAIPLILAALFLVLGLIVMGVEYFKKEK